MIQYLAAMTERPDTSIEAQMKRNLASDLRFGWGCQLAIPVMALLSLLPLGLASAFTDSLAVILGVLAVFNLIIALAAFVIRRLKQQETLLRSMAGWLLVISPVFAGFYVLMAASYAFDF